MSSSDENEIQFATQGVAAAPATPAFDPPTKQSSGPPRAERREAEHVHSWILEPPASREASVLAPESHAPAPAPLAEAASAQAREEPVNPTVTPREPGTDPCELIMDLLYVCCNVAREAGLMVAIPTIDRRTLDTGGDSAARVAAPPQAERCISSETSAPLGEDIRQSGPTLPAAPTCSATAEVVRDVSGGEGETYDYRGASAQTVGETAPPSRKPLVQDSNTNHYPPEPRTSRGPPAKANPRAPTRDKMRDDPAVIRDLRLFDVLGILVLRQKSNGTRD